MLLAIRRWSATLYAIAISTLLQALHDKNGTCYLRHSKHIWDNYAWTDSWDQKGAQASHYFNRSTWSLILKFDDMITIGCHRQLFIALTEISTLKWFSRWFILLLVCRKSPVQFSLKSNEKKNIPSKIIFIKSICKKGHKKTDSNHGELCACQWNESIAINQIYENLQLLSC